MKRRLFNLAAATSLVMCVALAALWVRSRWYRDTWYRLDTPTSWSVSTTSAGVAIGVTQSNIPVASPQVWRERVIGETGGLLGDERWSFLGFSSYGLTVGTPRWTRTMKWLVSPYWFLMLVSAILQAFLFTRLWAEHRRRHCARNGLCPTCGYDLRPPPTDVPNAGRCRRRDVGHDVLIA